MAKTRSWIDGRPEEEQPALQKKAYIANILPFAWIKQRPYGVFHIASCPEDRPFIVTAIDSRNAVEDVGDKKRVDHPVYAGKIAADLVREINGDAPGEHSFFGVFLFGENGPTKQEIENANRRVDEFCRELVRMGNMLHERRQTFDITDLQRFALKRLNLEDVPWDTTAREMKICEGCGRRLRKTAAVCTDCGTIADPEKYARLQRVESGRGPLKPGGGKAISA